MIRLVLAFSLLVSPAFAQTLFTTNAAAQLHCPGDTIVWLNTTRHIYRVPGEKGYGRSKNSSFACQKEADTAGDRVKIYKPRATTATLPSTPQ